MRTKTALTLLAAVLMMALLSVALAIPVPAAAQTIGTPTPIPTHTPALPPNPDGTDDARILQDDFDVFKDVIEAINSRQAAADAPALPQTQVDGQSTAATANVTWDFPADMPASTRNAYRALYASINSFSEREFGWSVDFDIRINIVSDEDFCGSVIRVDDTDHVAGTTTTTITMWLGMQCIDESGLPRFVMAHEYFHLLQFGRGDVDQYPSFEMPLWMIEGSAEYFANLYADAIGIHPYANARDNAIENATILQFPPLEHLTYDARYVLGFLAFDYLARQAGRNVPIELFRLLEEGTAWEYTFNRVFGMPLETFYENFEAYRAASGFPSVPEPTHAGDRAVLVTLYNATGGPNWIENANWLSDEHTIFWHGVSIDRNGRVTTLHLYNNGLIGEIPPDLGGLSEARSMDFRSNRLSGEIPPELGNIPNLSGLFLGGNELTGCIPETLRDVVENDFDELGLDFCEEPPPEPPTDDCLETITARTPITHSGEWANEDDCNSVNRPIDEENEDDYLARYYTFTLSGSADVTITLESSEDTYLYLLEGVGRNGAKLCENDDNATRVGGAPCNIIDFTLNSQLDSGIVANLEAGSYTIEATTYRAGATGAFTLTVTGLDGGTIQLPPPSGAYISLVVGELHTCGLHADGSVVCWGNDGYGQVSDTPIGDRFMTIAAGTHHTCGIRTDSTVVCWGRNDHGESSSPTDDRFSAIFIGAYHTCGIRTDGSAVCWGRNDYGQSTPP